MSVSGYSGKGGYPQPYPTSYPGGGTTPTYPGSRTPNYPGSRTPNYPGSATPTYPGAPQVMSTSFTTAPSNFAGSRSNVYPAADTSMVSLLPAVDKTEINTDYVYPIVATVLCPVLGLMAMYHTHTARQQMKQGNKVRANVHVQKSNTFYGYSMCVGIALWMFILAIVFVIVTHALIGIKHYSVSMPGKYMNNQ